MHVRLTGTGRDESSKQLIKEIRLPIEMKPGQEAKEDFDTNVRGSQYIFGIRTINGKRCRGYRTENKKILG